MDTFIDNNKLSTNPHMPERAYKLQTTNLSDH